MTEIGITGGYLTTDEGMEYTNIICKFTVANKAEYLTLESEGISIAVNFKDLEEIVKKARKKGEVKSASI